MRIRSALVALGLSSIAARPVAAAPCRPIMPVAQLVTPKDAAVPADGGVLVSWVPGDPSDGVATTDKGWSIKHGKRKLSVTTAVLAPGLVRYDADGAGVQQFLDGDGKQLLSYTRAPAQAGAATVWAAAPEMKAIEMVRIDRQRFSTTTYTAKLTTAVPAKAVAVIVYTYDKKAKADVALRWAKVAEGNTSITLDWQGRSCGGMAQGTVALQPANKLSLAWVDATGRVSAHSKVIGVTPVADVPTPGVPRPE
ncbi:MAG TPA: hypothetical protein PLF40_28785 [Kofleriaceae bacterium]|nr:hypothetical protein [Kofleriaceae bacterium]